MRNLEKINVSLIDNHSFEDVLLNQNVIKNRARSVSPEFMLEYETDECVIYLYDLIAYIMLHKKDTGENIDREIIDLFRLSQASDDDDLEDFISIEKNKYETLMMKLSGGKISDKLRDYLIMLYIYNEAKMENDFLLGISSLGLKEHDERNNAIELAMLEIKSNILNMKFFVKYEPKIINNYVLNNNSKVYKNITFNGKKVKKLKNIGLKYVRKDSGKVTKVFEVKIKKRKKEEHRLREKSK